MSDETKPQTSSESSRKNPRDQTPMGRSKAAGLVARLLKGYPYLNLGEQRLKDYSEALKSVLEGYPLWAGEQAIQRVGPDENPQFLPTDRRIRAWCNEAIGRATSLQRGSFFDQEAKATTSRPYPPPVGTLEQRREQALQLEQQALRSARAPVAESQHWKKVLADIEARKKAKEGAQ